MNGTLIDASDQKTYRVVFDLGEEVLAGIVSFAKKIDIQAAYFTAIGALSDLVVGHFDVVNKQFTRIPINEQVEILSLVGNIVLDDGGNVKAHAHLVVGKVDGTAHGGHLLEAHVRPTLELIIVESPKHLRRRLDPNTMCLLPQ